MWENPPPVYFVPCDYRGQQSYAPYGGQPQWVGGQQSYAPYGGQPQVVGGQQSYAQYGGQPQWVGGQQSYAPYGGQPQGVGGQKTYATYAAQPQGGQQQVKVVPNQQMEKQCPDCHAFGTVEKTWTCLHVCLLFTLCFVGGFLAFITVCTLPRKCRNCGWKDQTFTNICCLFTFALLVVWVILIGIYVKFRLL